MAYSQKIAKCDEKNVPTLIIHNQSTGIASNFFTMPRIHGGKNKKWLVHIFRVT
jgi:hypothetical protein